MIELPGGGRLYTEDEEIPTVEELIASMTPEQLAASAALIERLHALRDMCQRGFETIDSLGWERAIEGIGDAT